MRTSLPRGFVRFYENNGSKLLRLPKQLAVNLPEKQIYKIDLRDEGILLVPVDSVEQDLPTWVTKARRYPPSEPALKDPTPKAS